MPSCRFGNAMPGRARIRERQRPLMLRIQYAKEICEYGSRGLLVSGVLQKPPHVVHHLVEILFSGDR